jgi:predicted RNase H-like HicB family nuclease
MNYRYEIIIHWNDEDKLFVAEVPELPGCMAHGKDYDDALSNIKEAIELWIDTAKKYGDPIPKPKGRLMYA